MTEIGRYDKRNHETKLSQKNHMYRNYFVTVRTVTK